MKNLTKLEKIFHSALELSSDEREEFLRQHCGDETDLRREVESLLSFEEEGEDFIESPPEDIAEDFFQNRLAENLIGKTLNHYQIVSLLGVGGMGKVYLAQDTKLNRRVAIKFLSDEFSKDADKLNRFVQEAQSASGLNHPNIITIHEIGEFEGSRYIATEFIEGETLNKYLKANSVKLGSVLDIAIQIASALDEAHSAGIIHRDIKPDNVMVRENGLAKILDFGIAKLTEKQTPEVTSEDATAIQVNTTPGMIIGTANYMSPEQAKGQEVDARTDIFSFGVVLYEIVAGHLPFVGKTPMEIIGAVIHKEPKPMDKQVPVEIQRIISKALRKDRDERYQTIKDLLIDLQEVRQGLEFQDKLEKTVSPEREEPKTQMFKATTVDDGQQSTTANDSIAIKKSSFNKIAVGVLAILLVSAIGFGYWYFSSDDQINSIAVMPFVNESGNEDVEYLSDGMTETLISSLTEIPNLLVKARSTVFYYKGKQKSVKEIGDELNVEAVLLGRVTQRGEELKLTLELVNARTLDAIWSETYNRKMSDLVSLQSEIAKNVSDKLRLKLTTDEQKQLAKIYTNDSEAQRLYLKGLFHWNKRKTADFEKALEYFNEAIEKDPNYALAYTGLADTYSLIPHYGDFRPKDYYPRAIQAAKKALDLDPNLAEAHASLGLTLWKFAYDWKAAETEFKKAIELNPNYATAHQWYGEALSAAGKSEKGIKEIAKAQELDPFSRVINRNVGRIFYEARRYDEAIIGLKKAAELFPDDPYGLYHLSDAYAAKGNNDAAIDAALKGLAIEGVDQEILQRYRNAYETGGWTAIWQEMLNDRLKEMAKKNTAGDSVYVGRYDTAELYARVGDKANAIKYLQRAYENHEPEMFYIKSLHHFDILHQEPEFIELVKKLDYPE